MKKTVFNITLFSILVSFGYNETRSQELNSNHLRESVSLFTDRTLYITGEKIQFAAYLILKSNNSSSNYDDDINDWGNVLKKQSISKILNIELITPDGLKIAECKYHIDNSFSTGCIAIPNEIETGPYYLRAYTKFMRNNGPSSYCYIFLKIINPLKETVLKFDNTNKDTLINQNIIPFSLNKEKYSTREQVVIQFKGINIKDNALRGLNLTVIPESSFIYKGNTTPVDENYKINQNYYPESTGLSLSGELKDSKSEKLLPYYTVNLSILGNCKDFMSVKSDSTGHFFFKIPYLKGIRNIFLCTEAIIDSKSTILIDNDFCQNKVSIPTAAFYLSEMEKKVALNLALNSQIASHFNKIKIADSAEHSNVAFYGEPHITLNLDNYIELPTIEDYIFELIPLLKIKKHKGKKSFLIISDQEEMNIYKPLVLLDMVAIDSPEKILALSPQKISRFEIINTPYLKGDVTYGGIISIFSKKNDFANIDLSSSGVLLDYNFLTECAKDNCFEAPTLNHPDTRNTLLWMPNFVINSKSKIISFTTSDTPGKYIVLLRGITNQGKEFVCKSSFEVQEQMK